MANQEEPIRIVIEEEDLPLIPDKPGFKAPDVKAGAKQVGDKATELAQKAWDSESRRKVTDGVKQGVSTVATKSSKAVANKVAETMEQQTRQQATALQNRVQEIDWKEEAKKGSAQGLRWLSEQLTTLADRVTAVKPPKPTGPDDQKPV
jgi:transcriptional regulator of nitric oxide reductase